MGGKGGAGEREEGGVQPQDSSAGMLINKKFLPDAALSKAITLQGLYLRLAQRHCQPKVGTTTRYGTAPRCGTAPRYGTEPLYIHTVLNFRTY